MDELSSNLPWRKSSRSNQTGCVELAPWSGDVAVRDSKDSLSPVLRFSREEMSDLFRRIRAND